jgi:Ca2+-binding RTX toxin-like protein
VINAIQSAGGDIMNGNRGLDSLTGGMGADTLRGGQGDDLIRGAQGDDLLFGDLGTNSLRGGAGADVFHAGPGVDQVSDFSLAQGDRVQLDPGVTHTESQSGADTLITLSDGGQMTLAGVQMTSLTGDWIFNA